MVISSQTQRLWCEGIIPFQSIVPEEVELVVYFLLIFKNTLTYAHTNIHAHTLTPIKECMHTLPL